MRNLAKVLVLSLAAATFAATRAAGSIEGFDRSGHFLGFVHVDLCEGQ